LVRGERYSQITRQLEVPRRFCRDGEGYELEGSCTDVNKGTEIRQVLVGRLEVFMWSVEQVTNVRDVSEFVGMRSVRQGGKEVTESGRFLNRG
jgi:hypothetical protein